MPTYLGIDIGTVAVKVAVIKSTYRKTSLAAVSTVDVAAVGGTVEAVRAAVAEALGGKTVGNDGVAVSIEGVRAAVRSVRLPQSAQRQLNDVLTYELESLVPLDMSSSVFDYRVLPRDARSTSEELEVLAAVARTEDVRARIDLVKGALGVEPERVAVGAFPLANVAAQIPQLAEGAAGTIVILDVGNKSSEVLVIRGGEPVFARTISFGTEGLPASAPRLAREVRVTLAAYRTQGGETPSRVYLCGGGAFVSSAEGFFGNELELPVEQLPTPALDASALPPAYIALLPRFAKAIGLALDLGGRGWGFNLRRGALNYERGFAWVRERVPVLAGLGAVILVSFVFSSWAKMHALSSERAALESALGTVTKEVLGEETTSASRAEELMTEQTAINDEDPMPHADAFDVMVKLSEDIPASMKHDVEELDVQKGHVVVHGIVGSVADAQQIASNLGQEACFQDWTRPPEANGDHPSTVKITHATSVVGGDRQKYVMEFDLKCPEDLKTAPRKKGESSASSAAPSASGGK
jgi:general secretion pathway protein L